MPKSSKAKSGPEKQAIQPRNGESPRPNWPVLSPLLPAENLQLETILEDQIVVVRKFFTKTLCQRYVSFLSTLPLTTTPGKPRKGEALRVNDRFQIDDSAFAQLLFESTCLKDLLTGSGQDWGGEVLGLNPNIRIYRYTRGQFFDQHCEFLIDTSRSNGSKLIQIDDESNRIYLENKPARPAKTTWTLLLYLTDLSTGCHGGETVFYPESEHIKQRHGQPQTVSPISVAPELGMMLLHKHGEDCLLHEGKEVTGGEKWIIRSDLCVART